MKNRKITSYFMKHTTSLINFKTLLKKNFRTRFGTKFKLNHVFTQGMGIFLVILLGLGTISCAKRSQIVGSGSTAINPFVVEWILDYYKKTGKQVSYNSIGSGGGISNLMNQVVEFAGSDKPLSQQDLDQHGIVQFPLDVSAIVVVVNLSSIEDNQLVLTGSLLAKIYMGDVTQWNDPRIQKLNPNIHLPHISIITIHRSDGSGTTYNFTNYLSSMSPTWQKDIGTGTVVHWEGKNIYGAKGNPGVVAQLLATNGSIGYTDWVYAIEQHVHKVRMINASGAVVALTDKSLQSGANSIHWQQLMHENFINVPTNPVGKQSWPIIMVSFGMIRKDALNKQKSWDFFKFGYEDIAPMLRLKFQPIPVHIQKTLLFPYVQQKLKLR